ncbi:MAG TPA: hypothetical protein PL048_11340 [Leptospiraceae bacterium]|nr:hypothetical protein [Leptospiraceae bacterium]HNF15796.1 hypothetical protein [Leptospiraceae bacterium]HNM04545.1 hypothetical protein [Leptospiraceae bacterium]HNN06706.1 hypothetical protein [Leptospiraceae bacterium]
MSPISLKLRIALSASGTANPKILNPKERERESFNFPLNNRLNSLPNT